MIAKPVARRSTGVSEAQREFVKMLAEIAVAQYLQEETETAKEPVERRDEVAR